MASMYMKGHYHTQTHRNLGYSDQINVLACVLWFFRRAGAVLGMYGCDMTNLS